MEGSEGKPCESGDSSWQPAARVAEADVKCDVWLPLQDTEKVWRVFFLRGNQESRPRVASQRDKPTSPNIHSRSDMGGEAHA